MEPKIIKHDIDLTITKQYVEKIATEIEKQVAVLINEAVSLESYEFTMLCLFSLIDSFAQECAGYERGKEQQKFADFVLKYQSKWPFLEMLEPVTLFYRMKDKLKRNDYLNFLVDGCIYDVGSSAAKNAADSILADLHGAGINDKDIARKIKQHQLAALLYQMRNKISHELSSPTHSWPIIEKYHKIPYYMSLIWNNEKDENEVQDDVWELIIPVSFVKDLAKDCISNYLKECVDHTREPFMNNSSDRNFRITWYDK